MATGSAVTAAGIDHVRLSYVYLDQGDLDGYGSMFAPDAELIRPDEQVLRGQAQIEAYRSTRAGGRHTLDEIFAVDGKVAVTGRLVQRGREIGFADIFVLSEYGLLRSQKTYFFVRPT